MNCAYYGAGYTGGGIREYEFVLKELEELGIEFVTNIGEHFPFCSLGISGVIEFQEIGTALEGTSRAYARCTERSSKKPG